MTPETIVTTGEDMDVEMEGNQFVTFAVGGEMFATSMAPVQEIIRVPAVARVPLAPASLLGLANLRGRVLPIVNLRHVFGLPNVEATDSTRALVIDFGAPLGFVVDRVASVIAVDPQDLEPVADIQTTVQADLLTGVVKGAGGVLTMVLDFERIVKREFAAIAEVGKDYGVTAAGSTMESEQEGERDEVQLVSFTVERQEFAADITNVKEIVQAPQSAVQVPNAPPHVLGLMMLRERLLPLVSLRQLLGLPIVSLDETQRVVVLSLGTGQAVGVVADSVDEVLRVPKQQVEPMPTLLAKGSGVQKVSSICRLEGGRRLVSVIDTVRIFDQPGIQAVMEEAATMEASGMTEAMNESNNVETEDVDDEEQMVVFRLGAEEFGVPITAVQEILRVPDQLTRVPTAPDFVEGVINLRGSALPVIDQRRRLGLPPTERSDRQRIMVYALGGGRTGFIVDSVTEVLKIPRSAIEPAPRLSAEQAKLIDRMANLQAQGRLIQLMKPAVLLSDEEMVDLDSSLTPHLRKSLQLRGSNDQGLDVPQHGSAGSIRPVASPPHAPGASSPGRGKSGRRGR